MADKPVLIYGPYGEKGTVAPEELPAVQAAKGWRVATPDEQAAHEAEQTYSNKSTAEKVTSLASIASPINFAARAAFKVATGHGDEVAPSLPLGLESYVQGVSSGIGGGVPTVIMKEAVRAAGGDEAAKAYARQVEIARKNYEGLYHAGEVAGTVGGAVAGGEGEIAGGVLSKVLPGAAITRAGGAAERFVAGRLANVAEKGAIARAGLTAAELGARGGVEGALQSGLNTWSEAQLGDHELTADKLFTNIGLGALAGGVGGAFLGGAGSLAKSGVSAVAGKAGEGITALSKLVPKATEAVSDEGAAVAGKEAAVESTAGPIETLLGGSAEKATKDAAADLAWKAINGRKIYAQEANRYVQGGTRGIGHTLLRRGLIDAEDSLTNAALNGTPEALAPKIAADLETVGARIGEVTAASPAMIPIAKITGALDSVLDPIAKKAGHEATHSGVTNYGMSLMEKLGVPKLPGEPTMEELLHVKDVLENGQVPLQSVLEQRKALDELIYREGSPLNPSPRVEALRDVRRNLEDLIHTSLEEAGESLPTHVKGEYAALKKDYQALRIAKQAAEDAADRGASNRTFSLGDRIAGEGARLMGGLVGGLPGALIAGPAGSVISKIARERGAATAAVLLSRAADSGAITRAVRYVDDAIGRAASGAVSEPKVLRDVLPAGTVRERAVGVISQIAALQARPDVFSASLDAHTQGLSQTAPMAAQGVTERAVNAVQFLASKIPVQAESDPFDPHPAPMLTDYQASQFLRYAKYVHEPMRFFTELEHGQITLEGAEVAQTLMPKLFGELRVRTFDKIAELQAAGTPIPFMQRLQLGAILGIPATVSQRPDHARFLQQIASSTTAQVQSAAAPKNVAKRPLNMKPQVSALDRLEGK